jgi:hypothetical protein
MTYCTVYVTDMGIMGVDVAFVFLGNFSKRAVAAYALGIDSGLIIVHFH